MGSSVEEGGMTSKWVPKPRGYFSVLRSSMMETFFADDPFRKLNGQPACRKAAMVLMYFIPILEWGSKYNLRTFKADLVAGITITSLAIPQGISYAKLASLPPVIGLYSSFVPPLIYALLGSSKNLAVGTVAAASLLMASIIEDVASPSLEPELYLHLILTSTLIAGIVQFALGIFRLGILIDFLSHATIIGFMGGTATIIILQQLKGMLGLQNFTHNTDIVSVMQSVFSQTHKWRWESGVLGFIFLLFLLTTRYISKRKPRLFWISAICPLISVMLGILLVFLTHADKHGVPIVGPLKKGLNPLSISDLNFQPKYFGAALKAGIITGFLALAEGIAVGRSLATLKNEQIDGNKEMIAFGVMNVAGSLTSCYLTTGPFSKSAVNYNAGCKTAASNIVMSVGMMLTLLFLTPLFYYTPLVVLSAIIISAMLGLINVKEAYHLFRVDKFDFCVCLSAFIGVVFSSMVVGLSCSIGISIVKALLYIARPGATLLGRVPETMNYIDIEQYPRAADRVPGLLIIQMSSPIYFANAGYAKERIWRWIADEEEHIAKHNGIDLQYLIINITGLTSIDTTGIHMLQELKRTLDRRGIKLVLTSAGIEVMEKLTLSKFIEFLGPEYLFLTLHDAVSQCQFILEHTKLPKQPENQDYAISI